MGVMLLLILHHTTAHHHITLHTPKCTQDESHINIQDTLPMGNVLLHILHHTTAHEGEQCHLPRFSPARHRASNMGAAQQQKSQAHSTNDSMLPSLPPLPAVRPAHPLARLTSLTLQSCR